MFSSGRKCEEAEEDQLGKTQEGQAQRDDIEMFPCNASLDHPFLFYLTLSSTLLSPCDYPMSSIVHWRTSIFKLFFCYL